MGDDTTTVEDVKLPGGKDKPKLTQISVCWSKDLAHARRTAHRLWPIVALDGKQFAQLETPADFERACAAVSEEDVSAAIVCGPDPLLYREAIDRCLAAGFDGVALHQIGPDQESFFEFWQSELRAHYGG